jgi:hypothetical protein
MKTTRASNGTVLEVGKKYSQNYDDIKNKRFVEMLYIGENRLFGINEEGEELSYNILSYSWLPYEEPQPKLFEGYQKWYVLYQDGTIMEKYGKTKEKIRTSSYHILNVYDQSEILELGLKL